MRKGSTGVREPPGIGLSVGDQGAGASQSIPIRLGEQLCGPPIGPREVRVEAEPLYEANAGI